MFLLLLLVFTQFSSFQVPLLAEYSLCTYPNFPHRPHAAVVDVPANASLIELVAQRGSVDSYELRVCNGMLCVFYVYSAYLSQCRVVSNVSFNSSNTTIVDLTNILPRGRSFVYLDHFEQTGWFYSSQRVQSAFLNITYPAFTYYSSEPVCFFDSNQTRCLVNITVQGSGTCSYNSTGSTFLNGQNVGNGWNCSTGVYSPEIFFPQITRNESWVFLNTSLENQTLLRTLTITNPTSENLTIPYTFSPMAGYDGINSSVVLAAGESTDVFVEYEYEFVRTNYSFVPVFNYTAAYFDLEVNASNTAPIPFNLSFPGCSSRFVSGVENFSLQCPLAFNYSLSNWTAINESLFSVLFSLSLPAQVVNSSIFFSGFLSTNATVPDFAYSEPVFLNLTGDFLRISREEVERGNAFLYNYFLELVNPPNASINTTVLINFSEFDAVTLLGNESCNFVCLVGKHISANVFNQTNFSVLVLRAPPPQPQTTGSSSFGGSPGSGSGAQPAQHTVG
ncbi:hypothetical protein HY571_00795, partial [Candidatus Micrarchaeota archaeon]|nr:hypothetical protein [Candidatus Micrarchaeota archaeon]